MDHVAALNEFIATHKPPFLLEHWLSSLSDEPFNNLADLVAAAERAAEEEEEDSDNQTLSLAIVAGLAERGETSSTSVDLVEMFTWDKLLMLSVRLEAYRRMGWVEIHGPLSITRTESITVSLTEFGQINGIELPGMAID